MTQLTPPYRSRFAPRSAAVAAGLLAASTLTLTACADKEKPETTTPVVAAPEPEPEPEVDVDIAEREATTGINIDAALAELCSIERQETYFAFDSSKLRSDARSLLDEVADCVEREDLPGLTLIGHADPRGSDRYNLWLGQERASSVAGFLEESGLGDDELVVRSKGEELAHDDPAKWDTDRRVDIAIFEGGAPTVDVMGQGGTQ